MPRAYLFAVCQASSLDQRTNNFSLFVLVEQLQCAQFPARVPLEVHVYYEFEEVERGVPHEVRLELVNSAGDRVWQSPPTTVTTPSPRHRLILGPGPETVGIPFSEPGYYHLFAKIRPAGRPQAEPHSTVGWPLETDRTEAPAAPQ